MPTGLPSRIGFLHFMMFQNSLFKELQLGLHFQQDMKSQELELPKDGEIRIGVHDGGRSGVARTMIDDCNIRLRQHVLHKGLESKVNDVLASRQSIEQRLDILIVSLRFRWADDAETSAKKRWRR